ncbi:hypothetical protein ZWY2020_003666 [Hordeum vulgare]|nr:hypothetical protein ZWY2020_003666 [Hordeum vulgare]
MCQVLVGAVLCVSRRADDRPTMKDVVALLEEIRRPAAANDTKPSPATMLPVAAAAPMLTPTLVPPTPTPAPTPTSSYSRSPALRPPSPFLGRFID